MSEREQKSRTFTERAASRLYKLASGVSANSIRFDLEELSAGLSELSRYASVKSIAWEELFSNSQDSQELAYLFEKYGSDKSTKHNYHLIYGSLVRRGDPINIFEVGLGSNNSEILFSMGGTGRPGAAERAFRDWAPNARIFGADIDKSILFSEERIETYFVDQTRPETFAALSAKLPPLDLVIDDGLHTPRANLNTIAFALPLLKDNGALVVEDILPEYLPFWKVALIILSERWNCQLVKMKAEHAVIITAHPLQARNGQ